MSADGVLGQRRILVTGVGGAPAFDLARLLLRAGHEVIAADCDHLAPGLLIPGAVARLTAQCTDARYERDLLELCEQLHPDAIFSGVEQELPLLLRMRPHLQGLKVRTWLPPADAVAACVDKARFARVLREHAIPAPGTWLPHRLHEARTSGGALIVKPRHGQGSKNVHVCATRAQAKVLCQLVPDPIVQEYVEGEEFTADCLTGPDARSSVILRRRLLIKGGLAMVSETFRHGGAEDAVRRTLSALGMTGVCCVQGLIRADDTAVITEANARFAGAFLASVAAGADLVSQALRGVFGFDIDHERLRYRPGVRTTKYVETFAAATGAGADLEVTDADRRD
ncbi:MAG TPA: ATP-grasp domain-containing protein [Actinocrinis sp.]|uniref:ATP-grasp domain-containing protein n=1 Tax=Actinocrinis sp. TaxID=1920516 RepID=UPI002D437463|nr:ATP-grasp domain-containing protein [Actinocrinis sp.]HZU55676.1 ATP-grasp domain-containing protein [Actinocrinis sp.]